MTSPLVDHADDEWPAWFVSDGRRFIARYVCVDELDGLGLTDSEAEQRRFRRPQDAAAANLEILGTLYERLLDRGKPYKFEPWTPTGGQRIRSPRWFDRDSGTCLDFAVVFAAMCIEARLSPLIALVEGRANHALVVVDLERSLGEGDSGPRFEDGLEAGVATFEDERDDLRLAIDRGALAAVDVVLANKFDAGEFADAVESGRRCLTGGDDGRVDLVDVARLHLRPETRPYPPRGPRSIGISRRLSMLTRFRRFPSRAGLQDELLTATGNVALVGPQGVGKSMLAHRVAELADEGCGWFLPAADADTLIFSLASAELSETQQQMTELDSVDRRAFATSALRRLSQCAGPWVVVLDNANGAPTELLDWLPDADPGRGQLLLATSTNTAWWNASGFRAFTVGPLAGDDLEDLIGRDKDLLTLTAGRPLLATAFRALQARTNWSGREIRAAATGLRGDELDGPRSLWGAARSYFAASSALGEDAVAFARFAAWLPPEHIPATEVAAAASADRIPVVAALAGLGLLSGDDRLAMHRLVGAAIREELEATSLASADTVVLGVMASPALVTLLAEGGDFETVERLAARIEGVRTRGTVGGRPGERRVGDALLAIANIWERRGRTRTSSLAYEQAEVYFDEAIVDDIPRIAECLHGRARWINQHVGTFPAEEREARLRLALTWSERAEALRGKSRDAVGQARSRAMSGLLLQKLAGYPAPGQTQAELLAEALVIIEQSALERSRLLPPDHPEVARSLFNLGGARIGLARSDVPARAADHLARASDTYERVRDMRLRMYGTDVHPHIAACDYGLAVADYYRAMLLSDLPTGQRLGWLRSASGNATQALEDRQALNGPLGEEVAKTARLLAKIVLARVAFAGGSRGAEEAVHEFWSEARRAGLLSDLDAGDPDT